ncbi:low molecular weight phosphotyrosine protein phosphatase [Vibrio sp. Isolate25]|uniref:low molecular weight protein-tyrosine-phosphatase n=1 Tax=Vibrio sp. Isolate25 TaxID=2908535 RepID=UPI001EFD14BB|nr:low molecular weight protein-tyrosine-phosphatase [Vibrio sp. Isolate25]MCG9595322.1 low molecular weight phosphotyrosine protein phosphatase [Vibrio sp. Isolate25]
MESMPSILIVCMGNICRSPLAEVVLKTKADQRGLALDIASAGTLRDQVGNSPDRHVQTLASQHGYNLSGLTATQVKEEDFSNYDMVLAADRASLASLHDLCPREHRSKLALFLSYSDIEEKEIPDPYQGSRARHQKAFELIEKGSDGVLNFITSIEA